MIIFLDRGTVSGVWSRYKHCTGKNIHIIWTQSRGGNCCEIFPRFPKIHLLGFWIRNELFPLHWFYFYWAQLACDKTLFDFSSAKVEGRQRACLVAMLGSLQINQLKTKLNNDWLFFHMLCTCFKIWVLDVASWERSDWQGLLWFKFWASPSYKIASFKFVCKHSVEKYARARVISSTIYNSIIFHRRIFPLQFTWPVVKATWK